MKREKLLLLGNYRPAITLARELGASGYHIIVTRGGGEGLSEYSRFVGEVWDEPDPQKDAGYFIEALSQFLTDRPDITIVVPVAEAFVLALAQYAGRLPKDRTYATPSPEVVMHCLDKSRLSLLAQEIGVPVAPLEHVSSYDHLFRAARTIGFPLVIRPLSSLVRLNGRKVVIVENERALERNLPRWPSGHRGLIVQRRMPGQRCNHYFAAQNGRLVRVSQSIILKTDCSDGSGVATKGISTDVDSGLIRYTTALLEVLGYHGTGIAQFLVDPDTGTVCFLEINPRIAGSHAVPYAAGLELGSLAIELARPGAPSVPYVEGPADLAYTWTLGAIRGLKKGVQDGSIPVSRVPAELIMIIRDCLKSDVRMTWDWRDPLPTVMLLLAKIVPRRSKPSTDSRILNIPDVSKHTH